MFDHETLVRQLGGRRFCAMTGVKMFIKEDNGISFKIGRNSTRCNHVTIKYDSRNDAYIMKFNYFSMKKGLVNLETVDDIYAENLTRVFTDFTGLDTSL